MTGAVSAAAILEPAELPTVIEGLLADTLTWRPAPDLPALTVALVTRFTRVLGA
jgi:hypothetical protein